jgi:hypothetical protein
MFVSLTQSFAIEVMLETEAWILQRMLAFVVPCKDKSQQQEEKHHMFYFFHILISIIRISVSLPLVYSARQIIEAARQSTTGSVFHILISIINTCNSFP